MAWRALGLDEYRLLVMLIHLSTYRVGHFEKHQK